MNGKMGVSDWDHLVYFDLHEFDFPEEMDRDLIFLVDDLREKYGSPLYVSSDYRPEDPRTHGDGTALDLVVAPNSPKVTGHERHRFALAAVAAGFRRIGLYDHHFHVDVSRRLDMPQDVIWIGESS